MKTNTNTSFIPITAANAKMPSWRIRWTNTTTGKSGLTVLPFRGLIQAELECERLQKSAGKKPLRYTVELEGGVQQMSPEDTERAFRREQYQEAMRHAAV